MEQTTAPGLPLAPGWSGGRSPIRALRRGAARLRLAATAGLRAHEPITVALAVTVGLSLYFLIVPSVDLVISHAAHRTGEGFWLSAEPALKALRRSSGAVMGLLLVLLLGRIGLACWRARRLVVSGCRRYWFLLLGLALGPGLLVNGVLKAQWGRPCPVHLDIFGGEAAYVPVWWISDACASNCSFVSGEASSAAWMVAVAVVLTPRRWRGVIVPQAVVYAAALSMNRIAFGGHFLSDVLLSWSLTALVLAVLYRVTVASPGAARLARRRVRVGSRPVPA